MAASERRRLLTGGLFVFAFRWANLHSTFLSLLLFTLLDAHKTHTAMSAPTFEITTASPAHSSHSTASTESIQPMHQQQPNQNQQQPLGAKSFLMKKMAQAG